ncbi:rhomboid family intramembrane serine protease [Parasulfitobacter algicola]|uniref:Rhomboid family intramembrane serine protease n=1 Tax=Parasulfitobacter algicola TaxID=2614809 RepID=A0ABX2IWK9_9RHOB|nr:rhomboid family intramembrane serine protease [Sulfitobacter algicola]NSX54726.1 rhomboid family intramembrane serine protease [Sulfitobacter algicola]
MFPIRDHNPSEKIPFVTYILMALNIIIFASYWRFLDDPMALNQVWFDWAMVPMFINNQENIYTIFTSIFLHGGILHLAGNMLFLYIFGDNLEEEFGHFGFLVFYLFCGVAAGMIHVLADPASMVPTVGASGAIAGVMGGYLLLFPKARVDILIILVIIIRIVPIPAWLMLGLWFGLQLANGLALFAVVNSGGVAYWAHVGGFVTGMICVIPIWLYRGGLQFWRRTQGHPQHPEAQYSYFKYR